jgi:hypothetical protein
VTAPSQDYDRAPRPTAPSQNRCGLIEVDDSAEAVRVDALDAVADSKSRREQISEIEKNTEQLRRLNDFLQLGVARPGCSRHEFGEAIDIDAGPAREWLREHGPKYGLTIPYLDASQLSQAERTPSSRRSM